MFEIDANDFDHAVRNLNEIRRLIDVNKRLLKLAQECSFDAEVRTINEELQSLRTLELVANRLVKPVRVRSQ